MIYGVHFRGSVGTDPPGTMHPDCVYTQGQTSLGTERIKENITLLDWDLLLDFCNALSPSMNNRTDLEPHPRLGLIAERASEQ